MKILSTALALLLLSSGCHVRSQEEMPAVLLDPDDQTRAELSLLVSRMLNDRPVTLARNALTASSQLIIERRPHRDLQGRKGTDRMTELPEKFRLVSVGDRCVLIHERSGERRELTRGTCAVE